MSKYIHITRLALITQLQYKSFFVATLIRTFIQVLVSIFVWTKITFTLGYSCAGIFYFACENL